jgi:CRP/FNR family transcriptional regulator, cyclic AMP receptor protein
MEILELIRDYPVRSFAKGETILQEGEEADTIFAVRTGFIKVTSLHENGNEKLLWIAERYDIAPTEQLFSSRGKLHYFYTALSDGTLFEIKKDIFLKYATSDPALMREVAMGLSGHYDDLMSRLDSVEQTTIRGKIISTLIYLGKRFSANSTVDLFEIGLRLTQNDIASMVGSTRETISVELNLLKSQSAISYDRNKFVIDLEKLQSLDI